MILCNGKRYSLDCKETKVNNNTLLIGTTGSGKTRSTVVPNILECKGSYIVEDSKGNLYNRYGSYMKEQGYEVIRLSFIHPKESVHYNPLRYLETTQDITAFANFMTSDDNQFRDSTNGTFWQYTSILLNKALIGLILERSEKYGLVSNLCDLFEIMAEQGKPKDEPRPSRRRESPLKVLFSDWQKEYPDSWACKQFNLLNNAADSEGTYSSILISACANISQLDSKEINELLSFDEVNITQIAKKKTIVFVEVSDNDRSLDLLVNIFFSQAMSVLCKYADTECPNNELPIPVRFILDDFCATCTIRNFENMISTIRSRNISVMLCIQSLRQLEAKYGRNKFTIIDNCDTIVYMGGNDVSTAEEIRNRCNKTGASILQMPIGSSWIIRRGSKPEFCERNMDLTDYLALRNLSEDDFIPQKNIKLLNSKKERRCHETI